MARGEEYRRNTQETEIFVAELKSPESGGLWQRLVKKRSLALAAAKKKSLEKQIVKRKEQFGVDVYESLDMGKEKETRNLMRKCRYDIHQLNVEIYKVSKRIRKLSDNTDDDEMEDLIDPDTVAVGSIGFQKIIDQYSAKPRKSFTDKLFGSCLGRTDKYSYPYY